MLDPVHVGRPYDIRRVLRASDDEPQLRPASRRLKQQQVQRWLAVGAVCADIAEIPPPLHGRRTVHCGIDGAIERHSPACAPSMLQRLQYRTTGEGEIDVESWNARRVEIWIASAFQPGERDRRIDVVEGR